ncbi:carbohydrate ABC transporter permease [Paenibacillus piri]|uniref:Carbohydrate ABC transporter permease n=1 Tax=Paenibacillus piri TaxID=2547395 RepID=A0A4R5KJU9_9BACL|nr:carbohydrate ABC transporter permease [Paenibacillus piri]TDF95422.1 carbohydrate ABC transporter permease [Paenibacillus piri]
MKPTKAERLFAFCNIVILAAAALSCLLPIIHLLSISLSSYDAVVSGKVTLWPVELSAAAYSNLTEGTGIMKAFGNSVTITTVGVALSMLFTVMAAYPLSRSYFYARRPFTLFIVFTMLFGGGMIPTYLIIKSLGLVNTFGAIWALQLISPFNMLIMKTFFEHIPEELIDAARIDGCGETGLIGRIVLPLSLPVVATLGLFYAVGYWNAFMSVLIYMNDTGKYNLMVLVQKMIQSNTLLNDIHADMSGESEPLLPEMVKAAGLMVLIVPMLAVYPFIQKYFVKGVMVGAIKG